MKKIIALILALACAFAFIACTKKTVANTGDVVTTVNSTDDTARETLEDFLDAFVDLDFDKAKKYVDDTAAIDEIDAAFPEFDEIKGEMLDEETEIYEDKFEELYNNILDAAKKDWSYKIIDADESADKCVYTVKMTLTDGDAMSAFEELMEEKMEETVMSLYLSGEITEDMDEEEMMEVLLDAIIDVSSDFEFETTTEESEWVVIKEGNKWVVSMED